MHIADEEVQRLERVLFDRKEFNVAVQLCAALCLKKVQVSCAGTWSVGLTVQRSVDVAGSSVVPHAEPIEGASQVPSASQRVIQFTLLFGEVRIAEMRRKRTNGAHWRGVQVWIAEDRRVDDVADAVHTVESQDLRFTVAVVLAVEHAAVQLDRPGLLLIRRPRKAEARCEVQQGERIVLRVITKAIGQGKVRLDLP